MGARDRGLVDAQNPGPAHERPHHGRQDRRHVRQRARLTPTVHDTTTNAVNGAEAPLSVHNKVRSAVKIGSRPTLALGGGRLLGHKGPYNVRGGPLPRTSEPKDRT